MEAIRDNEFNSFDIRLIQSLWEKKPIQYIAFVLERPFAQVEKKVLEMAARQKVKLFKPPSFTRTLKGQEKEREWAKKQLTNVEIKVRGIDESQLITVRIDSKTVVRVKPGTDVEALRKKLLSNKILK